MLSAVFDEENSHVQHMLPYNCIMVIFSTLLIAATAELIINDELLSIGLYLNSSHNYHEGNAYPLQRGKPYFIQSRSVYVQFANPTLPLETNRDNTCWMTLTLTSNDIPMCPVLMKSLHGCLTTFVKRGIAKSPEIAA